LGDAATQTRAKELMNQPNKPFGSYDDAVRYTLEEQRQAATDSRAKSFYENELTKSIQEPIEAASQYHYMAKETGRAISANPYEYQADLAVELLKGAPVRSSEVFSPVSGEMSKYLPGGAMGVQQHQWNTALGKNENVNFMPGLAALQAAEGIEGPYGALYGGTGVKSITPESVGNVMAAYPRSVVTTMPTQVAGVGPDVTVKSAVTNVPTVGGLYVVPGSAVVFNRGETTTGTGAQQRVETSPAATWLEGGLAAGDALTSLPSTLTGGIIPAWTPGADLLKSQGLSGSQSVNTFQKELAAIESQRPDYDAILSDVQSKTAQLNTLTEGKINDKGEFIGTPKEYERVQALQSDIKTGTDEYNKFNARYQNALTQGYSSGAIIKGAGDTYQIAPETERKYGAFSDWSTSAQKLITGGMTPSKFAIYETTPEFAAAPWYERVGEGFVKTVTNPEEALQSGIQGVALYAGTAGLGAGLGALSKSTGVVGTVAGGATKIGESPLVKYGVPAVFLGAGTYGAAEGVDIGGPTLVSPKAGWVKFESNLGALGGNLAWMGVGAMAPGGLAKASTLDIAGGARRVYEAVNFPNTPTVGEIGGAVRGKVDDIVSTKQPVGVNGLPYDYDIMPQVGSVNYLKQKGVAFSPPSSEDVIRLGRADARTTEIFNLKTEGGSVVKPLSTLEKLAPQKGSLIYLQEKGIAFNPPSAEDVTRLRRAEVNTEAIFKLKTDGGGEIPTKTELGKIPAQKGSLNWLKEQGIAFSPPSQADIIKLNRADAKTNAIFNIKTEGGVIKPTVEEGKITPMKGSMKYLQEKGVAFNVPSAEDVIRLKRAEALTEGIFAAKTEGGVVKSSIVEGKITPMKGSLTWLKEQGIVSATENGPVETVKARGLSNYLGKYYTDLVKEVEIAGLNPESPDILSQLRAATKVEEIRLKKKPAFEQADILKNYDIGIGDTSVKNIGKLTPQVGSLTYLKEKGIISPKETGPEITATKQKTTDYLAKLYDNLISEVKSAGADPSSPQIKSQIDAEMKIREESIKKLNIIAKNDLFSGRKSLDELLSNKDNVINTNRVIINKKTWTNKELADRLKPRRWPSKGEMGKGVESGKGGQVLIQKLAQKTEQALKQEAKKESKQEVKQEVKLEKKKKLSLEEQYQSYIVPYNVKDYDMANVESVLEYRLASIPKVSSPQSELKSIVSSALPTIGVLSKQQPKQEVATLGGSAIKQPQPTIEKEISSTKSISDTIQKSIQDILKISSQTPSEETVQKQEEIVTRVPSIDTTLIPAEITTQMPRIKQITKTSPILDTTQLPDIMKTPDITQKPPKEPPIFKIPPIPLFGGGLSGGGGIRDKKKRYKPHVQVFDYNFDPWKAARITAKALAVGSNVTRGPKSSLPTFSLQTPKPTIKVAPRVVKAPAQKILTPSFKMPSINVGSTTGLKSISLASSLPQKKKRK
jgi:hypothetical protein